MISSKEDDLCGCGIKLPHYLMPGRILSPGLSLVKSSQQFFPARGAIAQLGERIVRNDEVVGSIPTSSTKF
jgi:hypothetical protein